MSSSRGPGESELRALKQVAKYNKAKDISGLKFITNQLKIVNHIKICDFPHSSWMPHIFSNDYSVMVPMRSHIDFYLILFESYVRKTPKYGSTVQRSHAFRGMSAL